METTALIAVVALLGVLSTAAVGFINYIADRRYRRERDLKLLATQVNLSHSLLSSLDATIEELSGDTDRTETEDHRVNITEGVTVTDDADAKDLTRGLVRIGRVDEVAKTVTDEAREATEPSWWQRFGGTVVAAVIAGSFSLAVAFFSFIQSDPPDCSGYANVLLAVYKEAPTNDAAIASVNALQWDNLDERCGSPADFLRPLGDPAPEN